MKRINKFIMFTVLMLTLTLILIGCTPSAYQITFDTQTEDMMIDSVTLEDSMVLELPTDPTKTGSTFGGWYLDSSFETAYTESYEFTADTTLYAKWIIDTFSLSFDSDGGSAIDSQTINYGDLATEPNAPTKEGYTFAYWYDNDIETAYDFTTPIMADVSLTAVWTLDGLSDAEKIAADVAALDLSFNISDELVDTRSRGEEYRSRISWESDSMFVSEEGVVLPVLDSQSATTATLTATFTLNDETFVKEYIVSLQPVDDVELTTSRVVPFSNLTTEYTVPDSSLELYFEEDGYVPYVKVEDFFTLLEGFIDPELPISFTTDGDELEIYYQYYDEDEDHTYDLYLWVNAAENTVETNDPGFYWAYVPSTETNYGRHIEYDRDNPDASYDEGSNVLYSLNEFGLDIVTVDDQVVMPYYIANQLFAGSSYYNVYYNYDSLYGIYSLPDSSSSEYRTIKASSVNNDDMPADLVVHTFQTFAFDLQYFYGLTDINTNLDGMTSFYELLLENSEKLLVTDPEDFDTAVATFLYKTIDEPHTSYGYPSYYNDSRWEVDLGSNLADYGSRFQSWYYDGLLDTDEQIAAKWDVPETFSGWASASENRPLYWFLDESKTSVVLSLDDFNTSDIDEADGYDATVIQDILEIDDASLILPDFGGSGKTFYYNNSSESDKVLEILAKGYTAQAEQDYKDALITLGYTHVVEDTTDETKIDGYYTITVDETDYFVRVSYDTSFELLYVGIADEVPTDYDYVWPLTVDIKALVIADSAVYMEEQLENILAEAPNLEDIVLDITWNTGGNVGALYRVVGFITDQPFRTSGIDGDTGGASSSYVYITGIPTYASYNWALLTTPTSFSAANQLATIFYENDLGPIIGIQTGGGASSITPILLPSGTAFTTSSTNINAYRTGAGTEEDPYVYHNNEYGITPDYPIEIDVIYDEDTILGILGEVYPD